MRATLVLWAAAWAAGAAAVVWTQAVVDPQAVPPNIYGLLNQLAAIADATYCITETSRIHQPYQCNKCDTEGLELVYQWFTYHADCGYVAISTDTDQEEVVIALRGTHSLGDGVQDIKADLIKCRWCDHCQVHRGFWQYFEATVARVNPVVMAYIRQGRRLRIIGHSLGGAVAILLGGYYTRLGIDPTVVTFGAPRLGNAELNEWVYSSLGTWFPVCHKHDPVPTVPQPYAPFSWQVFIDTDPNELPPPHDKVYWCNGCVDETFQHPVHQPMVIQPHLEYFRTLGLCQWQVPSPPTITVTIS